MIPRFHLFLISILILGFFSYLPAQLDSSQIQKIDSLFILWNTPNHPGGAVGVMKDNKVVFSRAYGLASLEYLVPNSPGTIFNIGSVSKQFTAMGIVLLQQRGQLDFDDDIRKYIPELPDFGNSISIRHLLHHTSGLRSLHALFALAGWRGDDLRTNEDLNRILLNQRELNFQPGSEYLYCNTGYMLMVNIIEKVTGTNFKSWIRENVFDALGMFQTSFEDQHDKVIHNYATSYYGQGSFDRAVEYWGYIGSGNVRSTVGDLLLWLANFHDPHEGWASAFDLLQTVDALTGGSDNNYAFGVTVAQHLGSKRIQHGGATGGYRTFACTYPMQKLDIIVTANFSSANPYGKADQIAELLLGRPPLGATEEPSLETITLSNDVLKSFEGSYWNDREKFSRKIYLRDDTLRYFRWEGNESPIVPVGQDEFSMLNVGVDARISFQKEAKKVMTLRSPGLTTSIFTEYQVTEPTQIELEEYTGTFYSQEVETFYRISLENEELSAYHPRHGYIPLKRLFKDVLQADWPLNIVQMQRDDKERVERILVTNGRVRNLKFERLTELDP